LYDEKLSTDLGFIRLRLNTPQPACCSVAEIPFTGLRGVLSIKLF
jgi:hypothetical protein